MIAHVSQDHVLDRSFMDHALQGVGEVGDDDDRLGAGVLELMFQFARGIERVDVHGDETRAQNAEQRNGILQQVGHHQRHPIPFVQLQLLLQIGGEGAGLLLQFPVSQGLPHVDIGRQITRLRDGSFKHLDQRGIDIRIDLGRDTRGITLQPKLFHSVLLQCHDRRTARHHKAQHLGYFAIGPALSTERQATKGQNCTEIFVLVDKIRCICAKFAVS